MKKIIISLSLLLSAGLTSAFAGNELNPDQKVLEAFKKEFVAAQNVSWAKQGDYDKATFVLADRRTIAYFNTEGELQGFVRDIFFNQLPLAAMTAFDKKYPGSEVLEVREVSNVDGTNYLVKFETEKKKVSVRVSPEGNIDQVEKTAK